MQHHLVSYSILFRVQMSSTENWF